MTSLTSDTIELKVLERLPDAVLVLDRDFTIRHVNPAANELFDRDITGRNIVRVLRHPDILDALEEVGHGAGEWEGELSLPAPVQRHLDVLILYLHEDNGFIIILKDTTSSRRAEEMRVDFVANVSHELRSPLSALIGFIETLQGPAQDDVVARERFLDIMLQESSRMTRLIDDLLSLSRVEINEHVAPDSRIDLRDLLTGIVDILGVKAEHRAMNLELHCPQQLPELVGEPDQITQVFQNLIDNAIKYGRPGTPVIIECDIVNRIPEADGPGVSVSIRDQGEGIPSEHIPRLTERFYRVDKARSRSMGGTGLGLAIVKHIISRHRGRLTIESTVGAGSNFIVMLPSI